MRAWIASVLVCLSLHSVAETEVSIIGDIGTISNYQQLLELKGGDPAKITDYRSAVSDRATVSLLLMVQALSLSSLDHSLVFTYSPNTGRSLREVKKGSVAVYQSDIWESEFDTSTYKSRAVIAKNTFEKGFYVKQGSALLEQDLKIEQLLDSQVALGKTWYQDIAQLEQIGFTKIKKLNRNQSLFGLLSKERISIAFLEFSNNSELAIYDQYGVFLPIPNYKVSFTQSRHFMVSKQHPSGKKIAEAIDQGLDILFSMGLVQKALEQSGVAQKRVENWQALTQTGE
ncbi:hypothetical protein [Agarivorans sp. DSG3-1]|uniref:hypothetical protein n=1 Tax=Agarivorans sp. DSG3-1 TaxID=3342249 RepID=UPI00398EF689